jgi:lysophospholipid acyltransferase (LPLAT)-like uncharacterized protein
MITSLFALSVSLLVRTLRITFEGDALPEKAIVTFWHSRMLVGWWVSRIKAVAMVSKSKDGEYLSKILSSWHYELVRGSSGKGGMEALDEAMIAIRKEDAGHLVITPDGPQGPTEVFKRGAFIAAKELELPLYFIEIEHKKKKVLKKSWDKFEIPLPFSSVSVKAHKIEITNFPEGQDEQLQFLQNVSLPLSTNRSNNAR